MTSRWDLRFLGLAKNIASFSKDPSTQVGCVIVGKDREIRTTGYNGLPRGARDNVKERNDRPEKYFWYEHAERNAIYNAARVGIPLLGCTAYTTLCPCMDCARALVQSGIKRVVTLSPAKKGLKNWEDHFVKSQKLFDECKIGYKFYD